MSDSVLKSCNIINCIKVLQYQILANFNDIVALVLLLMLEKIHFKIKMKLRIPTIHNVRTDMTHFNSKSWKLVFRGFPYIRGG